MISSDKELFKDCMIKLSIFYPMWKINLTNSEHMRCWFEMFSDLTGSEFVNAVNEHINKEKQAPTVASIRSHVVKEKVLSLPLNRIEEYL